MSTHDGASALEALLVPLGWELRPLGERLGAELVGPDLGAPLDDAAFAALQAVFVANPVLAVRGQRLGPEDLKRVGRRFGRLEPHSILHYRHPEHPDLSYITNVDADGNVDEFGATKRAVDWHSDGSFKAHPDTVTMLYSIAAPSRGGPTEFSDMRLAYETLPGDLAERIEGREALHVRGEGWRTISPPPPLTEEQEASGEFDGATHPVAIVHPWCRRTAIYVNPTHTKRVVGLEPAESDALLDALYEHAIDPAFQYHHAWREGDVLIWDQRAVLHRAGRGTPSGERRIMLRAMVVTEPHRLD